MSAVLREPERFGALRVPPHNADAEAQVLGAMLYDPNCIDTVSTILRAEDFYRREYREIFDAVMRQSGRGLPTDAVTLGDLLPEHRALLVEMARDAYTAGGVKGYAGMVRDKALRRSLIEFGTRLAGNAFGNETDTPDLIADTIGALMRMQKTEAKAEYTLRDAMSLAYKAAQEAKALGGAIPGIPSGLTKLDHLLGGWHDGDLIVMGARPAMGKTAMLVKFAMACGVPCGIVSAEQPAIQIGARAMSARSHVDASKFRNGAFDDEDIGRLMRAVSELVEHPCMIYDRSSPSIADVVRMARKWRQSEGIRCLFVDYVQRIEASNADRRTPKHERVGEVVRGLKTLARDLEIPVFALCQVGRQVEARTDKRPSMGDMSDSSEIEKEADQVLTLYREAVYFDEGGVNERNQSVRPFVAEINVEKNRHGPCGFVECVWVPESMRFENMGKDHA